jgi:hypothetical protein
MITFETLRNSVRVDYDAEYHQELKDDVTSAEKAFALPHKDYDHHDLGMNVFAARDRLYDYERASGFYK